MCYESSAAPRSTAVSLEKNGAEKRDTDGSNGSGSKGGIPEEPERMCIRSNQKVRVFCSAVHI